MANSILIDPYGPDWPLGFIKVVTPGIPVGIMSLVDPNSVNKPGAPIPDSTGALPAGAFSFSPRAQQIMFLAYKPAAHGAQINTGNIYICRVGKGGAGNRDDYGAIAMILQPGQSWSLASAAMNLDVFSPYRYFIDGDNANDGAFVTLMPQG